MLSDLVVLTATRMEAKAARRELPSVRVVEAGVALCKHREPFAGPVVSCGLAGGLRHEHETGTVLVPRSVALGDGPARACDPDLVDALAAAARAIGLTPVLDPLVTASEIVRGEERQRWAERGFAAVDMETALVRAPRLAAVRIVLDTPLRELSEDWLHPATAVLKPRNWPEMLWLAREAPRCAARAARVVARALAG